MYIKQSTFAGLSDGTYNQYGDYVPDNAPTVGAPDMMYKFNAAPGGVTVTAQPATASLIPATIGGINTKTLLLGLAVLVAVYLLLKRK